MLVYTLLFTFLLLLLTYRSRLFHLPGLSHWMMPTAMIIKLVAGLLLFLLHIQTYGIDELSHDGETFFKEGRYLNDVFFASPIDYFKLLTGIGENDTLIHKYLYMTEYWSAGDLSIVNDSKNVIRVHSLIHFFSFNSVFIHLSIFCLISLAALKNLYLSLKPYTSISDKILFWILLLVPSTIFWTSSMMKEPLMFLGLSMLLRSILVQEDKWIRLFFLLGAIALMLCFKPYVLFGAMIAILIALCFKYLFSGKLMLTLIFLCSVTTLFIIIFQKPRDVAVHYLTRKQFDFENVGKGGLHTEGDTCFYYFKPAVYEKLKFDNRTIQILEPVDSYIIHFGSTKSPIPIKLYPNGKKLRITYFTPGCKSFIETTPIDESFVQLMKNIPEALTNSYLRPYFFDPGSRLKYLSMIEIWMLTGFLFYAFFKRRELNTNEKAIIVGMLVFALILLLLIGWTTPVIGAIARYRFPAQLALVVVGLICIKPKMTFSNE